MLVMVCLCLYVGGYQHWLFPHEIDLSEMSWPREDH